MSTRRQHPRARRLAIAGSALGVCGAMLLVSCGGRESDEPLVLPEAPPTVDPGSGDFQCPEVTDEGYLRFTDYAGRTTTYELSMIEDWEFGAGSGWYTNNPQCTRCDEREKTCDGLPIEVLGWATNGQCDCDPDTGEPGPQFSGAACFYTPDPPPCPSADELERLEEELDGCWERCRQIQSPTYFEKPLTAERIPDGGRCGSRYALHLTAGPFDQVSFDFQESWGGVAARPVDIDAGPYPDQGIEGWDGICFWARRGPDSRPTIRLDVTERHTDQDFLTEEGCAPCNPHQSDDNPEEGCDKFGAHASLDGDWQFFAIPFAEIRQAGWGMPAEYFDVWGLRSIGFSYNVGFWDFWVDDIALYRLRSE